ncbi:MAG: hypothetical protein HYZ49_12290 [Chloroflexi bacterium]|nr:hypothetical protein [Chloroflexota bacterium]
MLRSFFITLRAYLKIALSLRPRGRSQPRPTGMLREGRGWGAFIKQALGKPAVRHVERKGLNFAGMFPGETRLDVPYSQIIKPD